jgi:hypothetical protein
MSLQPHLETAPSFRDGQARPSRRVGRPPLWEISRDPEPPCLEPTGQRQLLRAEVWRRAQDPIST